MLYIRHRINTVEELQDIPGQMGIELDLRSEGTRLVLQHDPFKEGEAFEDLLRSYQHSFLAVNVKTEGVADGALKLLEKYGIQDYFLLDLCVPELVRLAERGEKNIAVRFSEYEPVEQCLVFKKRVRWVWIDCFNALPLNGSNYRLLRKYFKLCVVSPELQGHEKEEIQAFKAALSPYEIDAVCTKYPELWKNGSFTRAQRIKRRSF